MYIEGSQVIIFIENVAFLDMKIDFVLANSSDHDRMFNYAVFHLDKDKIKKPCLTSLIMKQTTSPHELFCNITLSITNIYIVVPSKSDSDVILCLQLLSLTLPCTLHYSKRESIDHLCINPIDK